MKFQIEKLKHQTEAIEKTVDEIKARDRKAELLGRIENSTRQENIKNNKHIAIQMETGTGKTFTFISTIFQLHKELGYNKFVIIVPRVAIREGIKKSFEIFKSYFEANYIKHYNILTYEGKQDLSNVTEFTQKTSNLDIILLTKGAIDKKKTNILRDNTRDDLLGSKSYVEQMAMMQPIVIIDEPQVNQEFNSQELEELLSPKYIIGYSATQPEFYKDNIIYEYSPKQAYEDRQVKRLEYVGLNIDNTVIEDIEIKNIDKKVAKIEYNGKTYKIKAKHDLGKKLNLTNSKFNDVGKVRSVTKNDLVFQDGSKLSELLATSSDKNTILKQQIRETIIKHQEKTELRKKQGIKVLSLFFVDAVKDVLGNNTENTAEKGEVIKIFLKEYADCYGLKSEADSQQIENKYAYYFSEKTKTGAGDMQKKVTGTIDNKEKEMAKLILKDREKLLSLDNEVEFIFAHTSLGVGWDNPNIFNICFLRDIASKDTKKQFVGRGLRLCVNQQGERIKDDETINDKDRINNLTVIGSLNYDSFCKQYQTEAGWKETKEGQEPMVKDATKRQQKTIKMRDRLDKITKTEIKDELWRKLKLRTKWYLNFSDSGGQNDTTEEQNRQKSASLDGFYDKVRKKIVENKSEFKIKQLWKEYGEITEDMSANVDKLEDLEIDYEETKFIRKIKEKTWMSVHEIKKEIINHLHELSANIKKNYELAAEKIGELVNQVRKEHVMSCAEVEYQDSTAEEVNKDEFLDDEIITSCEDDKLTDSKKSLYEQVTCDSKPEEKFVSLCDDTDSVVAFVKLPKASSNSFYIDTPIGRYTPDFAVLLKENSTDRLYMVFEVKSDKIDQLSDEERFKIKCAVEHFRQLGFDVNTKEIEHKGETNLELRQLQRNSDTEKLRDSFSVYLPKNNVYLPKETKN